ncbi:MAG: hypothetical protein ABII97_02210 [Patescibacteria group bacterium]|nr:hypothetical protein [Patescibacteria group bacterium]
MNTAQQHTKPRVVTPPPVRLVAVPERACTWCKEAIKKDALVCPYCRREQKSAGLAGMIPKSLLSPGMAILGAILLSVAIFVSVFAAISARSSLDDSRAAERVKVRATRAAAAYQKAALEARAEDEQLSREEAARQAGQEQPKAQRSVGLGDIDLRRH